MNFLNYLQRDQWKRRFLSIKTPVLLRQSAISDFDYCQKRYQLVRLEDGNEWPLYYLLGSVFHKIIEDIHNNIEIRPDVIVAEICAQQNYDWASINKDINNGITWAANRCWDESVFYGFSLVKLAQLTYNYIRFTGADIVACEKKVKIVVGNVTVEGTIDILLADGTIIDTKSGGLYKRFFHDGSVSKQKHDSEQVMFSPQFQTYDWLLYRKFNRKAKHYTYALPANFIPLQSGKNEGKVRGPPLVTNDAVSLQQLTGEFENNLIESAVSMSRAKRTQVYRKTYPKTYGKIDCPSCIVKELCLGQTIQPFDNLPAYLRKGQ